MPVLLVVEGLPPSLSATNVAGFAYLSIIGGAVAYALWFAGLRRLPAVTSSFLGLLSPLVAMLLGWLILAQGFTPGQALGAALVLGALIAVTTGQRRESPAAGTVPRIAS